MKVALICDFLTKFGGAQRVLLALCEVYPDAPIYCLLYDKKGTKGMFEGKKIITSSLQSLPSVIRKPKFLFSKYPEAIESFDLSEYDLVISSSDSFAHGAITNPKTLHVCYCHTPMRYAWDWSSEYLKENKIGYGLLGMYVRYLLYKTRIWDKAAADRVDVYLANSENVKKRIEKYYRQEATVVYPPVNVSDIKVGEKSEDFFLIISRLEPYKNVKMVVETFNKSGKPLVIIGEGTQFEELSKIAKDNIKLLGWQTDEVAADYLSRCRAFIFPVEDDFGITPVEAMAAGKPVIALKKGGALETVINKETGIFFNDPTSDSLRDGLKEFDYYKFDSEKCRARSELFSKEKFKEKMNKIIHDQFMRDEEQK